MAIFRSFAVANLVSTMTVAADAMQHCDFWERARNAGKPLWRVNPKGHGARDLFIAALVVFAIPLIAVWALALGAIRQHTKSAPSELRAAESHRYCGLQGRSGRRALY
jgi:hypothetical protein